jgi:hypothetical protein
MSGGVPHIFDQKVQAAGANELPRDVPDDELVDIDPADFWDPEEFGIRQRTS